MIKLQAVKITCVSRYKVLADKRLIDQRFDLVLSVFLSNRNKSRDVPMGVRKKSLQNVVQAFPIGIQRALAALFGSFYAKERYCLIARDYHAYGLLKSAQYAKKRGYKGITCIEFGVASGEGLKNIIQISDQVAKLTGVDIKVFGFDTGSGLPPALDYRDNPEKWNVGDYPMPDKQKLSEILQTKGKLYLGLIKETLPSFTKELDRDYPVGFVSFDVDYYSSTKDAMQILDLSEEVLMPIVWCYFDDCYGSMFANKFCGELLAIEEFNQKHKDRKICKDLVVRKLHSQVMYRDFFEKMYLFHIFNHSNRIEQKTRATKVC